MKLTLQRAPASLRAPADYGGHLPARMRLFQPAACLALQQLEQHTGGLVYTDGYRSASAQLEAYRNRPGTQPVAYSAHGYGLAYDLDVDASLVQLGCKYGQMLDMLADYGWFCHRRDANDSASESWHFNFLGMDDPERYLALADPSDHTTWARPVELRIQQMYGNDLMLTPSAFNQLLVERTGFATVAAFQKAWDLVPDGIAGPKTQRVLAYVTAEVVITE